MTKNNFNNERLLFSDPLILGFEGNILKMIEEFLDKFLTEYLFSKNNTNYNNSIIFFENQHLEYSIPINQLTSKPLKF